MFIEIDFDDSKPIYLQLKEQIITGIAKGSLKSGEGLPSVRSMAKDIGMNLHTVNKAYQQLKLEGFIEIQKQKGVMVKKDGIEKAGALYYEQLDKTLHPIIAEAICRHVSEEEFIERSREIYRTFSKGGKTL